VNFIKFTTEWEREQSLPFLNTLVHRETTTFEISVYRKPTYSGQYLHYFSWHEKNIKRYVVSPLLLRAYRICSPRFLNDELQKIVDASHKSAYTKYLMDKIHRDVKRTFYAEQSLFMPLSRI